MITHAASCPYIQYEYDTQEKCKYSTTFFIVPDEFTVHFSDIFNTIYVFFLLVSENHHCLGNPCLSGSMVPVVAVKNVVFSDVPVKNVVCSEPERDSFDSNCEGLW